MLRMHGEHHRVLAGCAGGARTLQKVEEFADVVLQTDINREAQ